MCVINVIFGLMAGRTVTFFKLGGGGERLREGERERASEKERKDGIRKKRGYRLKNLPKLCLKLLKSSVTEKKQRC